MHIITRLAIASCLTLTLQAQDAPKPYLRTPSPRQITWQQREYYAFIHFGPNTFTDEEWGRSQSTPDVFAPTTLDTDQWAESFARAGMAGMILTAKHHDGMALWKTNSTTYKIDNGKWAKDRAAKGLETDVVRMAAASAKKYGIDFGIYLSPWDIHRDPAMPKEHLAGTIYAEPQIFGDSSPGDYNELYVQQLTELVTMKHDDGSPVEIFEIWLDGASGSNTVQTFNWTAFRDIIRQHQPNAIMWGHQGVDARWVGNEDGVTVATNWHTINRTQDDKRYSESELQTGMRDGTYWTPAEADARIRDGWFYHANEKPKTADALMKMYLQSVGQSVNLLLDVPPDRTGKIDAVDAEVLLQFKAQRDRFLNRGLLKPGFVVNASSVRGGGSSTFAAANVLTNDKTYWTMDDNKRVGSLTVDLGADALVDAFIVQEHVTLGQRIGAYAVDAMINGSYKEVVRGTSMGYKRIHQLTSAVRTRQLRLRIEQANAVPLIQYFQALGTSS
ncbi:glycoside hydrolase family 29 protein [Aaosphaeria arxii CBS 175.79]|uniref:alpha-L-fucosidase n=1 Tax=Aaosphaeria arxii CBS 175.79 TaxID=1450172 RepID=A0A6A5Y902_9PLEO|nr:glycoside hydrolase family 29 protein [Aaosphaeria arxii CBS 175.79]KAF2021064.1 glycoside hydrolase family 29 protein [Aaosphaeria arxii CBS 175.79]